MRPRRGPSATVALIQGPSRGCACWIGAAPASRWRRAGSQWCLAAGRRLPGVEGASACRPLGSPWRWRRTLGSPSPRWLDSSQRTTTGAAPQAGAGQRGAGPALHGCEPGAEIELPHGIQLGTADLTGLRTARGGPRRYTGPLGAGADKRRGEFATEALADGPKLRQQTNAWQQLVWERKATCRGLRNGPLSTSSTTSQRAEPMTARLAGGSVGFASDGAFECPIRRLRKASTCASMVLCPAAAPGLQLDKAVAVRSFGARHSPAGR